jgi:hypothetical protein
MEEWTDGCMVGSVDRSIDRSIDRKREREIDEIEKTIIT